jgi:glucan endo-1,3-alpha-glucosidase
MTGNDFSESSYICDTVSSQIVSGANTYVDGFPHSGFRAVLPYFIAAYKAGSATAAPPGGSRAVAWYRTTPVAVCGAGGTVWGQGGTAAASQGARDVVSIITVSTATATVNVKIGASGQDFPHSCGSNVCYFELAFDGRTGPVALSFDGRTTTGPAILNVCPTAGRVNFNSVAISL